MPTYISERTRTARKPHRCSTCLGPIKPGDVYRVSTNVYDDRMYDWKECEACRSDCVIAEVYNWAGQPDEGVTYEDAHEWATDHRSDEKYGTAATAFLSRRVPATAERGDQ
jgi:hypothetical protein